MITVKKWLADGAERHQKEVDAGLHDSECEYGPRLLKNWNGVEGETFLHMCHCSKRRRESSGVTTTPGALWYRNPDCPRCFNEVQFDGDNWHCGGCSVIWDASDQSDPGEFTDDHGDLGRPVPKETDE